MGRHRLPEPPVAWRTTRSLPEGAPPRSRSRGRPDCRRRPRSGNGRPGSTGASSFGGERGRPGGSSAGTPRRVVPLARRRGGSEGRPAGALGVLPPTVPARPPPGPPDAPMATRSRWKPSPPDKPSSGTTTGRRGVPCGGVRVLPSVPGGTLRRAAAFAGKAPPFGEAPAVRSPVRRPRGHSYPGLRQAPGEGSDPDRGIPSPTAVVRDNERPAPDPLRRSGGVAGRSRRNTPSGRCLRRQGAAGRRRPLCSGSRSSPSRSRFPDSTRRAERRRDPNRGVSRPTTVVQATGYRRRNPEPARERAPLSFAGSLHGEPGALRQALLTRTPDRSRPARPPLFRAATEPVPWRPMAGPRPRRASPREHPGRQGRSPAE